MCENYVPTTNHWQILKIWWIHIHNSISFVLGIKIATYIVYKSSQCMTRYSQCLWYTDWLSSFLRKFTPNNDGCIGVFVSKILNGFHIISDHTVNHAIILWRIMRWRFGQNQVTLKSTTQAFTIYSLPISNDIGWSYPSTLMVVYSQNMYSDPEIKP